MNGGKPNPDIPKGYGLKSVRSDARQVMQGPPVWPGGMVASTLDFDKEIAYQYRIVLTGFNMKRKDDTWLLVLKGEKRTERLVSFVSGRDFAECIENAIYLLESRGLTWRKDKFK